MKAYFIEGQHPEQRRVFAAVDGEVRFVEGKVAVSRLGAMLAPFKTDEEARAAIVAAGATVKEGT